MSRFPVAEWADKSPGRWILVWIFLLALWILGASISPSEFYDTPKEKPVIHQPVQITQLDKMQEQLGPEGTCTELAKKTICKDKHGRRVITIIKEKK